MEVIYLVIIGSAIWVFADAGTWGLSRGWAAGVLLLWLVAFPLYLVERGRQKHALALPPLPQGTPKGWQDDPLLPGRERYWAGGMWGNTTRRIR